MSPADRERREPGDIIDRETGKARVMAEECSTCIFRPGDLMHLGRDRFRQVVRENLAAGALLTCHQSLPYGEFPDFPPAACRGFWDGYRHRTLAGRYAEIVMGVVEVDPPKKAGA
jgi:hypothetical protein